MQVSAKLSPSWLPIHHLRLLLCKALPYSLAAGHELLHTPAYTALFARDQRFGGEVINTVVEAAIDKGGEHLWGKVS